MSQTETIKMVNEISKLYAFGKETGQHAKAIQMIESLVAGAGGWVADHATKAIKALS